MKLDLDALRMRHPAIPIERAGDLILNAAIALQRRHAPGISMAALVLRERQATTLSWTPRAPADAEQLDEVNATELGAEAIALALVHATHGWMVRRRLQRREYADWLLVDAAGSHVAMEVSGTDDGDAAGRMRDKLDQVSKCVAAPTRVACVVRFLEPTATLEQHP
jgi:hypothetical protein